MKKHDYRVTVSTLVGDAWEFTIQAFCEDEAVEDAIERLPHYERITCVEVHQIN